MAISGATILETPIRTRRYQCAAGTNISGGDLLKLADPNTASLATGKGEVFAGICSFDKVATDGSTELTATTKGIFDIQASSEAISVGDLVMMSGSNLICRAPVTTAIMSGSIVGKALETASAWERIRVAVGDII